MIQPTTALRKICALKKRIWCLQGSQGAAKTYSVCIILVNHLISQRGKEWYIVSAELSKMRDTVLKDIINIIDLLGVDCKKTGIDFGSPKITFPSGSFIRFIGLDKDDVGKGLRSDGVYVNEANKINFESYRELTSRAKKVIIDYNPNNEFWAHKEVIPRDDCDFLKLTFLDNEYLSAEERSEILRYKAKGYNPDGSIKSEYWANKWQVYGLGNIGILEGAVFDNWTIIDNIPPEARMIGCGLDFGYTNDPSALVAVYTWNGKRVVDELCYQTGLLNSQIVPFIPKDATVYADSAEPKSIEEIRLKGVDIQGAKKGADSIVYGIQVMHDQEYLVTKRSVNLINELRKYAWRKDRKTNEKINKPIDDYNHAIDALRYHEVMDLGQPKVFFF